MPVPNPTTLELAQAGALIVGVARRDAQLVDAVGAGQRWDLRWAGLATIVVGGVVVFGLIAAVKFDSSDLGVPIAAGAGMLAVITLAATMSRSVMTGLANVGYTPAELAALLGYVELERRLGTPPDSPW